MTHAPQTNKNNNHQKGKIPQDNLDLETNRKKNVSTCLMFIGDTFIHI